MTSKFFSILLLFILAPLCFAAEIPAAKKVTPVVKTKILPTDKKQVVAKVAPKQAPLAKNISKPAPKIISPKKTQVAPKTLAIKAKMPMPSKQANSKIIPLVQKSPQANTPKAPVATPLKDDPEILIRNKKTKISCPIKNAPPPVKPSAIESTDLRKIAKEASMELQGEETVILGDLRILWQYAVENSETIKFAIYKLSDPKGDLKNADESKIKKLLKPIAGITPFVAATAGNPIAAGSSIIGGTFMNDVLSEDKYKKHLEKVTDADLVILAKAIEDLQNNLVSTYYEYITAKKILDFSDRNLQNRKQLCDSLVNFPEETVVIADTFYREALARQNQAQANLLLKRSALEQLVGNDAILIIENNKKPQK